jgi:ribosome maturation factor RimP
LPNLEALTAIIAPEAEALGFDLVRVAWFAHGVDGSDMPTLQIMAERPDTRQVSADECGSLSRRVSDRFDELDPIEEQYCLQVSSPGIDRPLTRLKDFADWAGHEAKVEFTELVDGRKNLRGDIIGVERDHALIEDRKSGRIAFPLTAIHNAKLVLTDRLIASTAPLNSAGVDEIDEESTTDNLEHEQED